MLESRVEEAQLSLFQCFTLQVVRAFLLEWCEVDDLPLDDMIGELCLVFFSLRIVLLNHIYLLLILTFV
jgi:hypothetical protein